MASTKATVISYTEKELEAIATLKANKGVHLSAKELGIPTAILTSLMRKATDERPMAEGLERVVVNKEDYNAVCESCGSKISHKLYWVD